MRGRRPVATIALLAGLSASLLGGCGGDDPGDGDAAASSATAAESSSAAEESTAEESAASAGPAAAWCDTYTTMVAGIEQLGRDDPADELAVQITDLLRTWAEQVQADGRPPGIDDAAWAGLDLLTERVLELPARPTMADLDAVEQELSAEQKDAISDAQQWYERTCAA